MENNLILGKMKSREIAKWMGISYDTFTHSKKKRLEELKNFCDFDEVYGGVIVKEIYIPTYKKGLASDEVKIYARYVAEAYENITSIAGMTKKLQNENAFYASLPYSTVYNRLRKAGMASFGEWNEGKSSGIYGNRERVWAVKLQYFNCYRFMTQEEEAYFTELVEKASINKDEYLDLAMDATSYKNGELDAENYANKTATAIEKNFFFEVICPFKEKFAGKMLVAATKHDIIMSQIEILFKGDPNPPKLCAF